MKILYLILLLFIFSCHERQRNNTITNICDKEAISSSKNGYNKNYYANSINLKSIGHYKNGIRQGFWKYFYRNGNVKAEGHYQNGKKQGYWKEYHTNGNVKSEGHIDHCTPSGYWKYYDKKNNVTKEINY
ncbi:MORN repeat variant [Aquimarina amphilecti]|uniref:MORN repeat variant n=1 Tax=Aquimarina amphilecti TaxID=1038014 RepID=A0A1H7WYP8_AQUAM|nr:hypothetical protein [Aquimarina amphilecti]SEM25988.1 MORN repeat variant [Aquimarina amphilecti]